MLSRQSLRYEGIIEARMASSRLPGKVMSPIVGTPMLLLQIERMRRAKCISEIVVATSTGPDDDIVADTCLRASIICHRGSLEDVLGRFAEAAVSRKADVVVRLTADCPLNDPEIVDALVILLQSGGYDYASNTIERTWPHGLDAEAMTAGTLLTAEEHSSDPYDREHVTSFIYHNPDIYSLGSLKGPINQPNLRLTVDYPEDLQVISSIYGALYAANPAFSTTDILAFLYENPHIHALNRVHNLHWSQDNE